MLLIIFDLPLLIVLCCCGVAYRCVACLLFMFALLLELLLCCVWLLWFGDFVTFAYVLYCAVRLGIYCLVLLVCGWYLLLLYWRCVCLLAWCLFFLLVRLFVVVLQLFTCCLWCLDVNRLACIQLFLLVLLVV